MPESTKRRVTMTNEITLPDGGTGNQQAVDYVPLDALDAYVADAETRWQSVEVSAEPDDGPGGPDGDTNVPENLSGASA